MNKKQKEALIIALAEKGKTYREITKEAGVSPNTIKAVLNKAGLDQTTSITSRVFELYSQDKSPLEAAVTLGLDAEKAVIYHQQYFMLLGCMEFTRVYPRIKDNPWAYVNLVKRISGITVIERDGNLSMKRWIVQILFISLNLNVEISDEDRRSSLEKLKKRNEDEDKGKNDNQDPLDEFEETLAEFVDDNELWNFLKICYDAKLLLKEEQEPEELAKKHAVYQAVSDSDKGIPTLYTDYVYPLNKMPSEERIMMLGEVDNEIRDKLEKWKSNDILDKKRFVLLNRKLEQMEESLNSEVK